MPFYMLLSKLTTEGRKTLHNHPERLFEVDREVDATGCRIMAQYALLGEYDFVTLIEAPSNETVAQLSLLLGARGTINIKTIPALPTEEFVLKLREAQAKRGR